MRELLTPKQVARAIGVSEASLKRWCDKGLVPSVRTAGGHRRLPVNGVMDFLRRTGQEIVRPEILGLPLATGKSGGSMERAASEALGALKAGDEQQLTRLVFNLYLGGHSVVEICDQALAPAFQQIGTGWEHGQVEVYEERRACEITLRVLNHLRLVLPSLPTGAPVAIGGTLEGDPYSLPTAMIAVALREAGWQAESYGSGHPGATLCAAIRQVRPRLLWLSVSAIASTDRFLADCAMIYDTASAHNAALAVGGRACTPEIRAQARYSAYCDNLRHLVAFAKSLQQSSPTRTNA